MQLIDPVLNKRQFKFNLIWLIQFDAPQFLFSLIKLFYCYQSAHAKRPAAQIGPENLFKQIYIGYSLGPVTELHKGIGMVQQNFRFSRHNPCVKRTCKKSCHRTGLDSILKCLCKNARKLSIRAPHIRRGRLFHTRAFKLLINCIQLPDSSISIGPVAFGKLNRPLPPYYLRCLATANKLLNLTHRLFSIGQMLLFFYLRLCR